jgi:hypothetical protein
MKGTNTMNTFRVQDVIRPPQAWYDWINSPEREAAMRRSGQIGSDSADGDMSVARGVQIADSHHRIRDVGAPLAQQDDTADVLDLTTPHAAMLGRWAAHDGLLDDERAAKAKAADGADVLDLSNVNVGGSR